MTGVVDVVNFNADASCLASTRWLAALAGGRTSEIYRWLAAFVQYGKRVSLGFTGATIADLATFNPETVTLIAEHPEVFELVLRPFSHDIALLRSRAGFTMNVTLGLRAINSRFRNVTPYFLPPEFMLTNEQLQLLHELDVEGVFINASRFKRAVADRIPAHPYRIRGVLGTTLTALPIDGALTEAYLDSLHCFEATPWSFALTGEAAPRFSWRDGESWLLLPDGLEREITWLRDESPAIRRLFVREAVVTALADPGPGEWTSYPVHSFSDWVREFRMLGYLQKIADIERRVETFSPAQLALWLQIINSDVLSAVEKDDPEFSIRVGDHLEKHTLRRSERGLEGEDFLVMFERLGTPEINAYLATDRPHLQKLRARIAAIAG